ncbi:Hint domain-containing protein [Lentibacter sp.]|uniref:Hint domain-containing protein n=1 Tax=Lentibacter sp. TaxID=2024994 RepID=UPI003F69693B
MRQPQEQRQQEQWQTAQGRALAGTPSAAQTPVSDVASWLEASTRVATEMGDLRVDGLWPGDRLLSEMGHETVVRFDVWQGEGLRANAPVVFSPGVLGNQMPLRVRQSQPVLIRLPEGHSYQGQSELYVPALVLVNGTDIALRPCKHISYLRLILTVEAMIFAEGAACEADGLHRGASERRRLRLGYSEAAALLSYLPEAPAGLPRLI